MLRTCTQEINQEYRRTVYTHIYLYMYLATANMYSVELGTVQCLNVYNIDIYYLGTCITADKAAVAVIMHTRSQMCRGSATVFINSTDKVYLLFYP